MRVFLRIDPDVLAAFPTRMRILATLTECAGIRWPLSRDTAGRDRFEKFRSQARESDLFHRPQVPQFAPPKFGSTEA